MIPSTFKPGTFENCFVVKFLLVYRSEVPPGISVHLIGASCGVGDAIYTLSLYPGLTIELILPNILSTLSVIIGNS
jgi:hypothetical protein